MEWQQNGEERFLFVGKNKNTALMLLAFVLSLGLAGLSIIAWEAVYGPQPASMLESTPTEPESGSPGFGENTPITRENFPFVFGALIILTLFSFLLPFLGWGQQELLYDCGDRLRVCKKFYGIRWNIEIPKSQASLLWNTEIWRYSRRTLPGLFSLGAGILTIKTPKRKVSLGKGLPETEEGVFRRRMAELFPQEEPNDPSNQE